MTPDVMRALVISGAILIAVVVLIVIITVVTVRRGEVGMAEDARQHGRSTPH
jgi:hypothetical protein